MSAPCGILIRSVNWLGDAIMALPAIDRLREAHPQARLTLLTHEKLAGLWEGTSHFDEVITFAKDESPFAIGHRLRQGGYDTALILPNSPRSALECWHARIPRRIGFVGKWRKGFLTEPISHHASVVPMHKRRRADIERRITRNDPPETFPASAHQIHLYLHLVKHLGASDKPLMPRLQCAPSPQPKHDRPQVGFVPGAEHGPAKRWPIAHFFEAGRKLIEDYQAQLLLLGSDGDVETTAQIAAGLPAGHITDLAGKTTLAELAATLAACDVVLTNDTGPMHVAAAVGTPVVVLFGSTSPDLTAPGLPGGGSHQLLRPTAPCSPCYLKECPIDLRCLNDITPAQAVQAVVRVLNCRGGDS